MILFRNHICICCKRLNINLDFIDELQDTINKLYAFNVGKNGQMLEWDKEYEENDIHHRHISHLYGVYPGMIFTENNNKVYYDACKKSLEIRGDNATGWSIAWKMNLWARFKDGDHSYSLFKKLMTHTKGECEKYEKGVPTVGVTGGVYSNLFDAHPPFQIDGNFGTAMAIIQWFVQCEDGAVKILPALPDELSNGKLSGIKADGNIRLFIEWENGLCKRLRAISPTTQTVRFIINNKPYEVGLVANKDTKIL